MDRLFLTNMDSLSPEIKQEVQQKKKQEAKKLNNITDMRYLGMSYFEYNKDLKLLELAELRPPTSKIYKKLMPDYKEEQSDRYYYIVNKGCIYFWSLNKKSAKKKLNQILLGERLDYYEV